jgi:GAF domain-containing protein
MALPLNSRGRTIGVLDVQSKSQGAFTSEDANNLSILADQIAAAIENATLHRTTQEALAEAKTLYTQVLQQGWQDYSDNEPAAGYVQELAGGKKLDEPIDSAEVRKAMSDGKVVAVDAGDRAEQPKLVVPIRLRGQVIGVMNIQGNAGDRTWTADQLEIAEASSERLALALENARLLQDSQRRAAKERVIGEITAKISSNIKTASVIETATEELQRALPNATVSLHIHNAAGQAGERRPAPKTGINVPILLRGEELGIINVRPPQGTTVKPDQMDLIYAVADRAALSLENARLFEETTRRAQRERLVTEITTKIRSTNDPQEMIRTAVKELREALGVKQIEVIQQGNTIQAEGQAGGTPS